MIWHILPVNDLKEHVEASVCHCEPVVTILPNGDLLITHSSYDRRELVEELLSEVNLNIIQDGM